IDGLDKIQQLAATETVADLQSARTRGALGEIEALEQVAAAEIASLRATKVSQEEKLAIYLKMDKGTKSAAAERAKIAEQDEKIASREKQLNRDLQDLYASSSAEIEKRYESRLQETAAAQQSVRDLEFEASTIGKTAAEVRKLELARADELARQKEKRAETLASIPGYEAEAEELRKQAALIREIAGRKGQNAIAQEAAAEWKTFTTSLYNGLTDSLFRSFEAGGKFFSTFWQGVKNTLKTTVLKFAIQGVLGVAGSAVGLGNAVAGAPGSSAMGLLNTGSNLYSAYNGVNTAYTLGSQVAGGSMSVANAAGTIYGNATGAGLDGLLAANGAYGTAGSGFMSTIVQAAPWVAAAAVALNAFGAFRSETISDTGIRGTLGKGSTSLENFTEWREGGTLFDGSSYTRRYSDIAAGQEAAIGKAVDAVYASVGEQVKALGFSAANIDAYTQAIDLSTKGLNAEQAQAKYAAEFQRLADNLTNQVIGTVEESFVNITVSGRGLTEQLESIASGIRGMDGVTDAMVSGLVDFSAVYGQVRKLTAEQTTALQAQLDALAAVLPAGSLFAGTVDEIRKSIEASGATGTRMVSVLTQYAKEGETTSQTLGRMGTALMQVNGLLVQLHGTALALSLASGDAASKLLDAAGGVDNLAALSRGYYDAITSDAQKQADALARVGAVINAAGFNLGVERTPDALKAEYDRVRLAQDLSTESGRRLYLQLLQTAPEFAELADQLYGATVAATSSAVAETDLAARRAAQLDTLRKVEAAAQGTTAQALAGVERAVAAERTAASAIFDARAAAASTAIDTISASVGRLSSASSKLRSVVAQFTTDQTLGLTRAEASGQLSAALAAARAGATVDADKIGNALSVIARSGAGQYTSFVDYARDFDEQAAKVGELANLTDAQLSVEERSLDIARDQLKAIEAARRDEMARLDGILESAKAQVDAINGLNTSTLSVISALSTLAAALQAQQVAKQAVVKAGGATNPGITGADIRDYVYNGADRTVSENAWYMDVYNRAVAEGVGSAQLADAMKDAGWTQQTILDWTASQGLKPFAAGGAFAHGVVSSPTAFDMGLMGEAGPEAILPLANVGGRLGVRSLGGAGVDLSALVEEMRELRADVVAAVQLLRAANSAENLGIAQALNRTEFILKKFDVAGMPPVRQPVATP
uniref:hypothetical protein n=1 Tax=uncultured Xylophilus sp. TaxID=296832 RepID=UPI0025D3334E